VSPGEAYLIARMQAALVSEGVLHSINLCGTVEEYEQQMAADTDVIRAAVTTAWPMLDEYERRLVRKWKQ
jgi:hypothetical protein